VAFECDGGKEGRLFRMGRAESGSHHRERQSEGETDPRGVESPRGRKNEGIRAKPSDALNNRS